MARPREFDEAVVLDAVVQTFWEHGYEGTSMSDLVERTGLAKGSLYKAFGDKRALFLRVLRDYADQGRVLQARSLQAASSGLAGLEAWLRCVADGASMCEVSGRCRGCFVVNASVELGPHDLEVRQIVLEHERRRARVLADAVRRAQAEGDVAPSLKPEAVAWDFIATCHGMLALGRAGLERSQVEDIIQLTLRGLRPD